MPNNFIFNVTGNPLYTQLTNTYTTPGIESFAQSDAAKSGALYTLTSGSVSVTASNSLLLQVANPSGSGVTMYVWRVTGGVSAANTISLYSGGTVTGGTTPAPFNMNLGSTNISAMTTRNAIGTIGGSPVQFTSVLLAAGYYEIGFNGALIVPPNRTLTVTIGTGALTASANISWYEF
ncbi:hypothetical protein NV379_08380 [Paenibacillus sp. N1-5-1-14]|uniref:hypothetical protein n=1 Tax=Paenibacillus radicibacter TaxID=2972488 RepID=UPI002159753B|nr:hypothetical protein [Paenibacillus radicibacter]MCR8642678.1 hypothetical protein [Paenibacillus radicibacter]